VIFINKLLDLYFTFAKIGGFTLGSGYAMIPIIKNEVINKKKWLDEDEILEYITLAQSIPGVIAINMATAIGKKVAGIKGAIISTLGMITCPAIIIIIIANFFYEIKKHELAQKIFSSIQALSVAMILIAVLGLYKSGVKDLFQKAIFILSIILSIWLKFQVQYIIIISGLLSLAYKNIFRHSDKNK